MGLLGTFDEFKGALPDINETCGHVICDENFQIVEMTWEKVVNLFTDVQNVLYVLKTSGLFNLKPHLHFFQAPRNWPRSILSLDTGNRIFWTASPFGQE